MIDLEEGSGVELLRRVSDLPRLPDDISAERLPELLAQEAAMQDFVTSYAHVVNSADIDAVVAHYGDDCVWINPRGRHVGAEEIRRGYGLYYSPVRWFNFWTNVTVRFVRFFDEAYISAYQYSIGVTSRDPLRLGAVSTDVWHLKRAESWKIVKRRVDLLDDRSHRLLPMAEE